MTGPEPLHGPARSLGTDVTSRRLRELLGEVTEDLLRTQMELRREQRARRLAEDRAERLRRLQALQIALLAAETPLQVGRALVEQGLTTLGASAGGLLVVSEDGLTLENLVAVGYPRDLLAAWQWIPLAAPLPAAEAARTGEPLWIGSASVLAGRYPELMDALAKVATRALAAVPLLVGTRAIGVLSLTFEEERVFGPEERHFATMLASQVALALDRARRLVAVHSAGPHGIQMLRRRDQRVLEASHDLKMPITAIKMTSQMLSHRLASSDRPEIRVVVAELARIDAALTRMSALVDELVGLTGGRPETRLARSTVDLVALVERVVAEAQSDQAASRITLHAEPPTVLGSWDAALLERVFANLLDNALKYSQADSLVRLTVSVEPAHDGLWAVVRIQDDGLGIPPADLPHVFESLQRAGNVVGLVPGTGVGLASVRDIVEQHGGSVQVVSQETRGSTFTVRLPLAIDRSNA
jgi:signal transduction histidine kinase